MFKMCYICQKQFVYLYLYAYHLFPIAPTPSSLLVFCITALLKRRWILYYYSGWLLCGIHSMRSIWICLVAVSWAQTEKAAGGATNVMEMQKNQLMKTKYHKRLAKIAIALSYNKYTRE